MGTGGARSPNKAYTSLDIPSDEEVSKFTTNHDVKCHLPGRGTVTLDLFFDLDLGATCPAGSPKISWTSREAVAI